MTAHVKPHSNGAAAPDPYRTFRQLSSQFHRAYFAWHSTGQYEGAREFPTLADVLRTPPQRERDDWYSEELSILERHYHAFSGGRTLEIGCGDGNLTWKLARRCNTLEVWDMDPQAIELTRLRLNELGLTGVSLHAGDGAAIDPAVAGRFQTVFFVQVLEHVPGWEQGKLFDRVFNLVAPGGCLFVSTPNRWTIRDTHDSAKLFIHWFPRWFKIPLAKRLNWGIPGQDPAWPYPPVLHDYVSFRWMLKRAQRACPGVRSSEMTFYPNMNEWLSAKSSAPDQGLKQAARVAASWLGRVVPLNYYFGSKAIFSKPPEAVS